MSFLWPGLFLDAWGRVWNEDNHIVIPPLNIIPASSKLCLSKPMVIPSVVIAIVKYFLCNHVLLLFENSHLQQEVPNVFLHVIWGASCFGLIWIAIYFYFCLKPLLHLLEKLPNSHCSWTSSWKTKLVWILASWIPIILFACVNAEYDP